MSFEKLPLHDAILQQITIDWENSVTTFNLLGFLKVSKPASPCSLKFNGVTDFRCPRNNDWGLSNLILDSSFMNGEYHIQMQSGDIISIEAKGYEFK